MEADESICIDVAIHRLSRVRRSNLQGKLFEIFMALFMSDLADALVWSWPVGLR